MNDLEKSFLADYEKLCKQYGLYIWSCGCCGPAIEKLGNKNPTSSPIESRLDHLERHIKGIREYWK